MNRFKNEFGTDNIYGEEYWWADGRVTYHPTNNPVVKTPYGSYYMAFVFPEGQPLPKKITFRLWIPIIDGTADCYWYVDFWSSQNANKWNIAHAYRCGGAVYPQGPNNRVWSVSNFPDVLQERYIGNFMSGNDIFPIIPVYIDPLLTRGYGGDRYIGICSYSGCTYQACLHTLTFDYKL